MTVTNCKYYIGGGSKPKRLRKNQNLNLYSVFWRKTVDALYSFTDTEVLYWLKHYAKGIDVTTTSKIIR